MFSHFLWWLVEMTLGYLFFYVLLYAIKNPVSIGWVSFILILLTSFAIFASPLTRHLSFWNRVIDGVVKKEEEKTKY